MKEQLTIAAIMAVLIWICIAIPLTVEAPKPEFRIVRQQPRAADLVIHCGEEHRRVCRARERTEKVKAKG